MDVTPDFTPILDILPNLPVNLRGRMVTMFLNRRDLTPILTDSRPRAVTKLGLEFVPHIPLARHHLNRVPTTIMFGPR